MGNCPEGRKCFWGFLQHRGSRFPRGPFFDSGRFRVPWGTGGLGREAEFFDN